MPLVRISLSEACSSETQNSISQAIHQALMEEFNIPKDDYFHIIESLSQNQLKFPSTYLGIAHTGNIVFVQIIAAIGRNVEQKKKLYQKISQLVSQNTHIKSQDVIITLVENTKENWSFGNGELPTFNHI
ncbi:tautomerase family protein [Chryseobacterium vrystaatense]|uniref:Tautomerase enzyme n=1 Tax=Chryseobacterium vrystaatense TaxID=307480 RepID=A0A1M5D8I2_9FLAO|nr:tautomerase family protein [Chryseobacterium vrystaatense]SHF63197.1 Tautomerase enzyme [Chryseobacterium vrystaatense]